MSDHKYEGEYPDYIDGLSCGYDDRDYIYWGLRYRNSKVLKGRCRYDHKKSAFAFMPLK